MKTIQDKITAIQKAIEERTGKTCIVKEKECITEFYTDVRTYGNFVGEIHNKLLEILPIQSHESVSKEILHTAPDEDRVKRYMAPLSKDEKIEFINRLKDLCFERYHHKILLQEYVSYSAFSGECGGDKFNDDIDAFEKFTLTISP